MTTPKRLLFLPFLFMFCTVESHAHSAHAPQDSLGFRPEVERLFVEAMRFFTTGQFDTAASRFTRNIKEYPRSHRVTGAFIMGAKAYYRISNYRESIRLLKDLIDLFPDSKYVDDAHYTLGLDYYRLERYEDAALELLRAFEQTTDARLRSRAQGMLETLSTANLSVAQLQLLMSDVTNEEMRLLVELRMAEKIYLSGDVKSAQEMIRSVASRSPTIKYVGEALTLLQTYEKGGIVRIGVVLPLMLKSERSSSRDLGVELLEGIQLAVDEYNEVSLPRVEIDVRDSERDPSIAARQVAELCGDDKVVSIIGPVFSNEVFASAGISNTRSVPMITPTATANGIASMGGFIFQANPDYEARGRAMARFAVQQLKDTIFAVLSPVEAPGKLMAEAFIDEAKVLGAELVDVQWYQAGATDLRTQLIAMRKKALEKAAVPYLDFSKRLNYHDVNRMVAFGVRQKFLDSLMEVGGTVPVDILFGKNGKQIADSLHLESQHPIVNFDSLGLPVQSIQAMFVPIASSEEIGVVGAQLRLFNFRTRILGTGEWQDPAELDQHREYVDNVIFSTDSYWEDKDPSFKLFMAKFQKAHKKRPSKNSLFGYDATKVLLHVVQQGASHRNEIAANLSKVQDFIGVHSKISLTERRVNSFLTILQFRARSIRKIGEVDMSIRVGQSP